MQKTNKKFSKIVLTGGGTMGHITPNIAIIPALFKYFDTIDYIGSHNSLEEQHISTLSAILAGSGKKLTYHAITSTKLDRVHFLKNLSLPIKLIKANTEAKKLLQELKPDVVFSKGGYVTVPVVSMASKLGIPTVIHESDLTMGLANKLSSKHAKAICTTFEETSKQFKNGVWTGGIATDKLLMANRLNAVRKFGLTNNLPTITITGGSLGATALNEQIANILPELVKFCNVIHITGKGKVVNYTHPRYHQIEFTDQIGEIFKASDLVISRAGSNTIFELAMLKVPMLLVPLPKSASRGDQIDNAKYFQKLGIARVLEQENIVNLLPEIHESLKRLPETKKELQKVGYTNGKDRLIATIVSVAKGKIIG